LIMFLACFSISNAQTWSAPVNISGAGENDDPDFTIDKFGKVHCVWIRRIEQYFTKVYYSNSQDGGLTWTNPIPITTNTDLWLEEPHIVADSSGNLYVSYDYNVEGKIRICYVKFTKSNTQWSQQDTIGIGYANRLIIDQNDRIMFFWLGSTECYRVLENGVLSDSIIPITEIGVPAFFDDIEVDNQNNIHCIGARKAGNYAKVAYFVCYQGQWKPYLDLSADSFWESGLSLHSNNDVSFVWNSPVYDSIPTGKETVYARLTNDSILSHDSLAWNTSFPAIIIDPLDQPHIVENQSAIMGTFLVHRYKMEGNWKTDTVEFNKYWYGENVLKSKGNRIYLVYNRIDTASDQLQAAYTGSILFRHLEVVPGIHEREHESELKIFPNPFSEEVTIEWPNSSLKSCCLKIFDVYGRMVYTKRYEGKSRGTFRVSWSCIDHSGNRVSDGYYYFQVSTASRVLSRMAIFLKQ
jgi:hypothetical protein